VRMRSRNFEIVSGLNLRERVVLAAGGAALVAAAFLSAVGDVSWLLPLAISCIYAMVVFGTWNTAKRRHFNAPNGEGRSERQSKQPALSVAYWSFFMFLLGLVMAWAAVSQLISKGGSGFVFVLLTVGVVLIGVALLVMATVWRHQSR
jgi:Ca2+/Na+ antiporter